LIDYQKETEKSLALPETRGEKRRGERLREALNTLTNKKKKGGGGKGCGPGVQKRKEILSSAALPEREEKNSFAQGGEGLRPSNPNGAGTQGSCTLFRPARGGKLPQKKRTPHNTPPHPPPPAQPQPPPQTPCPPPGTPRRSSDQSLSAGKTPQGERVVNLHRRETPQHKHTS